MAVYNFGSLNIDHTYSVPHFVRPGETIGSDEYRRNGGGKGANQSVALGRAGSEVFHVGKIGSDGLFIRQLLEESAVNVKYLAVADGEHTGHAIIQLDRSGENCIVLYGGTNHTLTPELLAPALSALTDRDFVLLQNETNLVPEIIRAAKSAGSRIYFNPAPMSEEVKGYPLELVDVLIVNETEGAELAGLSPGADPDTVLSALQKRWPDSDLLLTMGHDGAAYRIAGRDNDLRVPASPAPQVADTTGAGDTYIGYFLSARERGCSIVESMAVAARAAAIAVSRPGAIAAIPYSCEL